MYIGLLVKHPLFLSDFHETVFSRQIFENYPNVKFYENPSSGNRVVPCAQLDGRPDLTKLIVAFCNFMGANKKRGRLTFVEQRRKMRNVGNASGKGNTCS